MAKVLAVHIHALIVLYYVIECDCFSRLYAPPERNGHFLKALFNNSYSQQQILDFAWKKIAPRPISSSLSMESIQISAPLQHGNNTKKPYEVINMFLRKKRYFDDYDSLQQLSNISYSPKHILEHMPTWIPSVQTVTPKNNIEFYYWDKDELVDRNKNLKKRQNQYRLTTDRTYDAQSPTSNSSFLMFHIRRPWISKRDTQIELPITSTKWSNNFQQTAKALLSSEIHMESKTTSAPSTSVVSTKRSYSYILITEPSTRVIFNKFTKGYTVYRQKSSTEKQVHTLAVTEATTTAEPVTRVVFSRLNNGNHMHCRHSISGKEKQVHTSVTETKTKSTLYDKIKFFEMYDQNTPVSVSEMFYPDYSENIEAYINSRKNKKHNLLENVDDGNNHTHNESKLERKHTSTQNKQHGLKPIDKHINHLNKLTTKATSTTTSATTTTTTTTTRSFPREHNVTAAWTDYPFVAVYIYKPSKVYCDAASINPYWLVASASCLSRHHKDQYGEGQSPYVTYCGDNWWLPERITYVKYSLVHPSFHPTDKQRRNLYNIGLIQVVSSMRLACSSWSPVMIMSHQFVAEPTGSLASAVGWGLDRIFNRNEQLTMPKHTLKLYKDSLFSSSCPGNNDYSKLYEGVKNVYCLSLPPYSGEESDPVHGGLLLVEEKLVALYLQEERRPDGEQSAQYTGVWKLLPWMLKVAKEPETNMDMLLL